MRAMSRGGAPPGRVVGAPAVAPAGPSGPPSNVRRKTVGRKGTQVVPYLASLTNPCGLKGIKIPDDEMAPSSGFQTYTEYTLTPDASTGSFVTGASPTWHNHRLSWTNTNGVFTAPVGTDVANYSTLSTLYSGIRCVSMCLKVQYIGVTNQMSGQMQAAWCPRNGSGNNIVAAASLQGYPEYDSFPTTMGLEILWKPQDSQDQEYQNPNASPNFLPAGGTVSLPVILVTGNGLPNTVCVRCQIYANWECIPQQSVANFVQTTPSTANPKQLAKASKIMTAYKLVRPILSAAAGASSMIPGYGPIIAAGGSLALSVADFFTSRRRK